MSTITESEIEAISDEECMCDDVIENGICGHCDKEIDASESDNWDMER